MCSFYFVIINLVHKPNFFLDPTKVMFRTMTLKDKFDLSTQEGKFIR